MEGVDIREDEGACWRNTAYLSTGTQWPPDMRAGQVISFFKNQMRIPEEDFEELYIKLNMDKIYREKIGDLEEMEWRKVLFSLVGLKKNNNYIVRDLARGMPLEFNLEFKKSIGRLKADGCSVLYLSDDVFFAPEIGDRIGFMKKGKLLLELKASKMKKMSLKELYFQFLAEN